MPFNYQSPGVYVEEPNKGARPIQPAGTSVLAMVGLVRDSVQVDDPGKGRTTRRPPDNPTLIANWGQFVTTYGDMDQAYPGGYLHEAMYGYFLNGGSAAFVVGLLAQATDSSGKGGATPLLPSPQAQLLTAKGAPTLRLTSNDPGAHVTVEVQPAGEGSAPDSFNLVIRKGNGEPKVVGGVTLGKGKRNIVDILPRETDNLLTAEVLDVPGPMAERLPAVGSQASLAAPAAAAGAPAAPAKLSADLFKGDVVKRTGIAGLEAVEEVTIVACPDVVAAFAAGAITEEDVKSVQTFILNHCEMMKDRFAILDAPAGMNVQEMIAWRKDRMNFDSKYGALYYPWIRVNGKFVPPSGHLAGIYARVDGERGVHKAPANEIVRGAIGLERGITRSEQDFLNPIGVNCIRSFPGQGIRVWGARTLASDPLWRYINVRRLFCNVEESILQNTSWIVFEPNDDILWRQIRRDVTAFLTVVWRSGALFGQTADEAFYVKCDRETNPKELRDLGYCIIEIGMAPVKPAEFVVFRVSQKDDGAGTSE